MAAALQTESLRIMKRIRVFGLRLMLTSTFLNGMALVVLNKGSGIKRKISSLRTSPNFFRRPFFWLKERLSATPPSPPLPRSLQCSPLILAVSATFAPRSMVLVTSRTPSPVVSLTTRSQSPPPPQPDFASLSRSCTLSGLLRKDHFQDFSASLPCLPLLSRAFHSRERSRHSHRLRHEWAWHSQAGYP